MAGCVSTFGLTPPNLDWLAQLKTQRSYMDPKLDRSIAERRWLAGSAQNWACHTPLMLILRSLEVARGVAAVVIPRDTPSDF